MVVVMVGLAGMMVVMAGWSRDERRRRRRRGDGREARR
jgi:uncharacterized membrane protein YuzA (DUF378 family)